MLKKFSLLFAAALTLSVPLHAQNAGTGPVTKYTSGAQKGQLTESLTAGNGTTIQASGTGKVIASEGTATTSADAQAHIANTSNPHNVTKAQVGLGNVDNTSDAAKPVSTAQQTALDQKQSAGEFVDRYYLRSWNAKIARINYGSTVQAVVALVGDSWTTQQNWSAPLTTYLQSRFGNAGAGYVGINASSPTIAGATATRTGTWSDSSLIGGASLSQSNSSDTTTPGAWTVTTTANTLVIHYLKQTGGGTYRYRIDGGSWTSVSTANAGDLFGSETISGLSTASHTLDIEVTVAGASGVTLYGVDCRIVAPGIRVLNLGLSGSTAAGWRSANAALWQAAIAALSPDATIVMLGVNDASAGHTPVNHSSDLQTIIDRIRAGVPLCDVVLATPSDVGIATTYPMADYVAAQRSRAQTASTGYIDNFRMLGTYADANSRALYTNTTHINGAGGYLIANHIGSFFATPLTMSDGGTGVIKTMAKTIIGSHTPILAAAQQNIVRSGAGYMTAGGDGIVEYAIFTDASGLNIGTRSNHAVNFFANNSGTRVRIAGDGTVTSGAGILASSTAGRLGYGAGSGGSVTQTTSRTTGVTINAPAGAITLVSAAGSTSWQTFTVTNSTVSATDIPRVVQKSGTDLYEIEVTAVSSGAFNVSFRTTGGTTTEQPVFNFIVLKGSTS